MGRLFIILIYLWIVSGAVFLFYPNQHYNESGWGVLLKYILYIPILLGIIFHIIKKHRVNNGGIISIIWIIVCTFPYILGYIETTRYALYVLPAFVAFAPRHVYDVIPRVSYHILWLAALGSIYEYLVLGGFPRFQPDRYRAVSIFVNPNNLGIMSVLLYYFTLDLDKRSRTIAFILSLLMILASGSKTGLIAFVVLFAIRNIRINFKYATWGIFAAAISISIAYILDLIPLESIFIRFNQYSLFVNDLFFGDVSDLNVDNAFIQTWIEVGPLGFLMIIIAILYCAIRDRLNRPLWIIFSIVSVTTNIIYLFPPAYIFWFYVGAKQPRLPAQPRAEGNVRKETARPIRPSDSPE